MVTQVGWYNWTAQYLPGDASNSASTCTAAGWHGDAQVNPGSR